MPALIRALGNGWFSKSRVGPLYRLSAHQSLRPRFPLSCGRPKTPTRPIRLSLPRWRDLSHATRARFLLVPTPEKQALGEADEWQDSPAVSTTSCSEAISSESGHPLASLALLLFAAAGILLYSGTSPPSQITTATDRSSGSRSAARALSSPTVGSVDGARAIWELPAEPARAVLFVAHGCRCRPENFWPPSPRCTGCVGLPEDVAITARALRRRFAVLAVASAGKCWSQGQEVSTAKRVIQSWAAKNGLGGLPVAALGASSGGYFVSRLAAEMSLAAVVIMIAEGAFEPSGAPVGYPPTMFLHMPKDQRRAALVERNAKMLRGNGVEVRELRSLELSLTPTLLSDRIPGLGHGLSERIWKVFREEGFVDENGCMRKDGRATPWKDAVVKRGFWEEVSRWAEHIQEELNLAYGYHEMTSLHADEMFDWVEEHLT